MFPISCRTCPLGYVKDLHNLGHLMTHYQLCIKRKLSFQSYLLIILYSQEYTNIRVTNSNSLIEGAAHGDGDLERSFLVFLSWWKEGGRDEHRRFEWKGIELEWREAECWWTLRGRTGGEIPGVSCPEDDVLPAMSTGSLDDHWSSWHSCETSEEEWTGWKSNKGCWEGEVVGEWTDNDLRCWVRVVGDRFRVVECWGESKWLLCFDAELLLILSTAIGDCGSLGIHWWSRYGGKVSEEG